MELNSKELYQSLGKEKENGCFVFPSSTKREIRHFHVVVVQRRLSNVQKSVMHVQRCYFANPNLLDFCRSRCRRRRRCLRWLNTVLAVCEYMSFAKSWQEKGSSSQAETWQVKNILMKYFD